MKTKCICVNYPFNKNTSKCELWRCTFCPERKMQFIVKQKLLIFWKKKQENESNRITKTINSTYIFVIYIWSNLHLCIMYISIICIYIFRFIISLYKVISFVRITIVAHDHLKTNKLTNKKPSRSNSSPRDLHHSNMDFIGLSDQATKECSLIFMKSTGTEYVRIACDLYSGGL